MEGVIMTRIVPSQVVMVIDKLFPTLIKQINAITLDYSHLYQVSAIAALTDQIPQELITLNQDDYAVYVASLAAIKNAIQIWTVRGNVSTGNLETLPGLSKLNPVTLVRRSLEKCPDDFPAASTTELLFINDYDLRDSIRIDISTSQQAFNNGEWKASTILAGSAIEALILWKLKQADQNILQSKVIKLKVSDIEQWGFHNLLEAANAIGVINKNTYAQTMLAKDFRNLIHPGRALRLKQKCTRATALVALASLAFVVDDMT
jgi:hypothetical protein